MHGYAELFDGGVGELVLEGFGGGEGSGEAQCNTSLPNAGLVMHPTEEAYWLNDRNFRTTKSDMQIVRAIAVNGFRAYRFATQTATEGEVVDGITMTHLPGHTPGHCGYWINSDADSLLFCGDAVYWPDIQIPRSDVGIAFDHDPTLAARTRLALIETVVIGNNLIGGMHLNFPGFLRICKDELGHHLLEERWHSELV